MKTRYKVLIGWLAIELAALPFALPALASFKHRVSLKVEQKAIAVPLPPLPGERRFLVASNGPFSVIADNVIGELSVSLTQSGEASGVSYGSKSQLPGESSACGFVTAPRPTRIYTALTKTAQSRGTVTEQAVLVTIKFDPETSPDLTIKPMEQSSDTLLAMPCDGRNS